MGSDAPADRAPSRDRLAHRIALVTGAGSGLGRAIAVAMAREGARIMAADVSAAALAETLPGLDPSPEGPHVALVGDVSDPDRVRAIVEGGVDAGGRIDILVNSAGIGEGASPTLDQTIDHWQRIIDINLTGTYLMCQAAAARMRTAGGGVILNMSSIAGVLGLPQRTAYTASKSAVSMITRTLASEWGPFGIRVNAIAPGYIRTAMTDRLIEEGRLSEADIVRRSPSGRMGTPEDVAAAFVFLASDEARFVSGAVLPVDGGYMAHGAPADAYPGLAAALSEAGA